MSSKQAKELYNIFLDYTDASFNPAYAKWNYLDAEGKDELARLAMTEFYDEYKEEIDDNIDELLGYIMEDNFQSEYKQLKNIVKSSKKESKKVLENKNLNYGDIIKYKGYLIQVDDNNDDNPEESICTVYASQDGLDNGVYVTTISATDEDNIKEIIDTDVLQYIIKGDKAKELLIDSISEGDDYSTDEEYDELVKYIEERCNNIESIESESDLEWIKPMGSRSYWGYPYGKVVTTLKDGRMFETNEEELSLIYAVELPVATEIKDDTKQEKKTEGTENSQKYIYSDANSDNEQDAKANIMLFKQEAPNLEFKLHKDGDMYFIDFIGDKQDIIDYLIKLGWYTEDEIKKLDIIKELNESKKTEDVDIAEHSNESKKDFSGVEFEKEIPHTMRFKEYSFITDEDDDNCLYWVTQQFFNENEVKQFADAFSKMNIAKAYVTVRDLSWYDYAKDKDEGALVKVNRDGSYDMTDYLNKCEVLGYNLDESKQIKTESPDVQERIKSLKLMDQAARCVNDDDVFELWLMAGVPDGASEEDYEDIAQDAKMYQEVENEFKRVMKLAKENGALYDCPEEALELVKKYEPNIENYVDGHKVEETKQIKTESPDNDSYGIVVYTKVNNNYEPDVCVKSVADDGIYTVATSKDDVATYTKESVTQIIDKLSKYHPTTLGKHIFVAVKISDINKMDSLFFNNKQIKTKSPDVQERVKLLKLMDQAARCVNDDNAFQLWLMSGIPDEDDYEEVAKDDKIYEEITKEFEKVMKLADENGALYDCPAEAFKLARKYEPNIENYVNGHKVEEEYSSIQDAKQKLGDAWPMYKDDLEGKMMPVMTKQEFELYWSQRDDREEYADTTYEGYLNSLIDAGVKIDDDLYNMLMQEQLEEVKFKDKVKAIKKSLKDKDGRLSDKTAEEQAKKIAGSMIKNESENKEIQELEDDLDNPNIKGDEKIDIQNDIKYIKDKAQKENRPLTEEYSEDYKEGLAAGNAFAQRIKTVHRNALLKKLNDTLMLDSSSTYSDDYRNGFNDAIYELAAKVKNAKSMYECFPDLKK